MQTIIITITGQVQGVFFRQSARKKAQELGITGTVSNLDDGSVQVTATGAKEQLEFLVAWCRQGPPRADVKEVVWKETPLQMFNDFKVLR